MALSMLSVLEILLHKTTKFPNSSIAESRFVKTGTSLATILLLLIILLRLLRAIINSNSKAVYLVDFACYKPKETQRVSTKFWINHLRTHIPSFKEETLQLMEKMASKSGVGEFSYLSTGLLMHPPSICLNEAEETVFEVVDRLLEKTGVEANEVAILVVDCGLFNMVPSLCSMVVNRYKMREDVYGVGEN